MAILLPLPNECWHYRREPPHQGFWYFFSYTFCVRLVRLSYVSYTFPWLWSKWHIFVMSSLCVSARSFSQQGLAVHSMAYHAYSPSLHWAVGVALSIPPSCPSTPLPSQDLFVNSGRVFVKTDVVIGGSIRISCFTKPKIIRKRNYFLLIRVKLSRQKDHIQLGNPCVSKEEVVVLHRSSCTSSGLVGGDIDLTASC